MSKIDHKKAGPFFLMLYIHPEPFRSDINFLRFSAFPDTKHTTMSTFRSYIERDVNNKCSSFLSLSPTFRAGQLQVKFCSRTKDSAIVFLFYMWVNSTNCFLLFYINPPANRLVGLSRSKLAAPGGDMKWNEKKIYCATWSGKNYEQVARFVSRRHHTAHRKGIRKWKVLLVA